MVLFLSKVSLTALGNILWVIAYQRRNDRRPSRQPRAQLPPDLDVSAYAVCSATAWSYHLAYSALKVQLPCHKGFILSRSMLDL